jgi:hypothetical protein
MSVSAAHEKHVPPAMCRSAMVTMMSGMTRPHSAMMNKYPRPVSVPPARSKGWDGNQRIQRRQRRDAQ